MATTKEKRPLQSRMNEVDRLSAKLALAALNGTQDDVSDATTRKGRRQPKQKLHESPEKTRAAIMKAVNGALLELSRAVTESGAKSTSASVQESRPTSTSLASYSTLGSSAKASLRTLRHLSPQSLDVERAALSLAGKLIALNVTDVELGVLGDIWTHLPNHYKHCDHNNPKSDTSSLSMLRLPIPTAPVDATVQASISSYFTYALQAVSRAINGKTTQFESFCEMLEGHGGILSWLPHLTALPIKSTDSLLKRTYTALASSLSPQCTSPTLALRIRFSALRALLFSVELDVSGFWEQCIKFAVTYAKSEADATEHMPKKEAEAVKIKEILACFNRVAEISEGRKEGKGWIAFCEYWLALAKRARDSSLVHRVSSHIRAASSDGCTAKASATSSVSKETSLLVVQLSAALAKLTGVLDMKDPGAEELVTVASAACTNLRELHAVSVSLYLDVKLRQDVEKCRKMALRAFTCFPIGSCARSALVDVLQCILDITLHSVEKNSNEEKLQSAVDQGGRQTSAEEAERDWKADAFVAALDTLLQLAVNVADPQRADTCDRAYDLLDRASQLISKSKPSPSSPSDERRRKEQSGKGIAYANYSRCLSGAYAHIANVLFRAERHSLAVRFLLQACRLSVQASTLREESEGEASSTCATPIPTNGSGKGVVKTSGRGKGKRQNRRTSSVERTTAQDEAKEKEHWRAHRMQTFKRWELLGVCYSKTGDRKAAYDAFVQGIAHFPFKDSLTLVPPNSGSDSKIDGSSDRSNINLDDVLASEALRPLTNAIDRATLLGACDLRFPASSVSLSVTLHSRNVPTPVLGAVLVRQVRLLSGAGTGSLSSGGKSKPALRHIVETILGDLLNIYDARQYPVRRASVMVLQLEHIYFTPPNDGDGDHEWMRIKGILSLVEKLLSPSVDPSEDTLIAHLRPYYLTMANLWTIMHAHRARAPVHDILAQTLTSLDVLRSLSSDLLNGSVGTSASMDKTRKNSKRGRAIATEAVETMAGRSTITKLNTPEQLPDIGNNKPSRGSRSSHRKPPMPHSDNENCVSSPPCETLSVSISKVEVLALCGLMIMTSELLGLSGLLLAKMNMLHATKQLLENVGDRTSETYLQASTILAHEHLGLGNPRRSAAILAPLADTLSDVRFASPSAVVLLLRYAEALAVSGDTSASIIAYESAARLSEVLLPEGKDGALSTAARIRERVVMLERIAIAASTFAAIRDAEDDPGTALASLLQALRLLNRAMDALDRLHPEKRSSQSPKEEHDLFAMSDLKDALPRGGLFGTTPVQPDSGPDGTLALAPAPALQMQLQTAANKNKNRSTSAMTSHTPDGLEWRVARGLFLTLLSLSRAHAMRGSAREALFFVQQAAELAQSLKSMAPAFVEGAHAAHSELLVTMGRIEESGKILDDASKMASFSNTDVVMQNLGSAEVKRLRAELHLTQGNAEQAKSDYAEAAKLLLDTAETFDAVHEKNLVPRGSRIEDSFACSMRALILKQRVWLLRDMPGQEYDALLEELMTHSQTPSIRSHVNSLLGKLSLYNIHERFRSDMSLSSLAESTIALPIGMTCEQQLGHVSSQEIREALSQADEYFESELTRHMTSNGAIHMRDAAVARALLSTYQSSLRIAAADSPLVTSHILDMGASITLQREMVDAIAYKYHAIRQQDDMQWPSLQTAQLKTKVRQPSRPKPVGKRLFGDSDVDDSDGDEMNGALSDNKMKGYWEYVLKKYKTQSFISAAETPMASEVDGLPDHWVVVSITLTEDKNALLVARQRPRRSPIVFCVPLQGCREDNEEDETRRFVFDDAVNELNSIINSSDEGTRRAAKINPDDRDAKTEWWTERKQLDQRMRALVQNIEFCWLGAFKVALSEPRAMSSEMIDDLRIRIEKVFRRITALHERKSQKVNFKLDDGLLELISALPPACRNEELEDIIYFILDMYHFHGFPVALSEIDMDVVSVDLRTALEEHHARMCGKFAPLEGAHTFLVLDRNVQPFPWESIPVLRNHSISRVPSVAFITDRLAQLRFMKGLPLEADVGNSKEICAPVDPSKGYYVLNPSGDLSGTETRLRPWVESMRKVGWRGVVGKAPSEQDFLNALSKNDLVVYFGHGGAEQYARPHKIRHLTRCATTMLWGCSSGALRALGCFDRTGTPHNYMLAGCPALVANLWDVTDRDIDKFAQSVFDRLKLSPEAIGGRQKHNHRQTMSDEGPSVSVTSAVAQSRDVCKLKYLTGAAVVVYGVPVYL